MKWNKNQLVCRNFNLIEKLAPTIYNSMAACFDEIFDLLIDEVLIEEAIFLNRFEDRDKY